MEGNKQYRLLINDWYLSLHSVWCYDTQLSISTGYVSVKHLLNESAKGKYGGRVVQGGVSESNSMALLAGLTLNWRVTLDLSFSNLSCKSGTYIP